MPYGPVILFGSGETARHGRQAQELVLKRLPVPARVAILETSAGYQPNVDYVTAKLRTFVEHNLQNYRPDVTIVPARGIGHPGADPNDPAVAVEMDSATYILAGPGSPTYTARTLAGSMTLERIRTRWADGAGIALASAAAIAFGTQVLPVYEIYKAGEDLGWRPGLDLFAPLGLDLAIVPHWNNREGGEHLDTSRCYMGEDRFARLRDMLPLSTVVLGIDEHTSCIIDPEAGAVQVCGQGAITVISGEDCLQIPTGTELPLAAIQAHAGMPARR
jgi:hypothetical protein